MRYAAGFSTILFVLLLFLTGSVFAEEREYVFAVMPQQPPLTMNYNWTPLVETLSRETGAKMRLKVYNSVADFETDLNNEVPDFAFMTPIQAANSGFRNKYIPLVRDSRPIAGVVFVQNEAPLKELKDLKGKAIALVGTKSVCSIITRNMLSELGLSSNYTPQFLGSVDNVVKSVLIGKAAAGVFLDISMEQLPSDVRSQLRILLETQKIKPHPISAHKRIAGKLREKVREAMIKVGRDSSAKAMMAVIGMPSPVRADYNSDYRPLEKFEVALSQ